MSNNLIKVLLVEDNPSDVRLVREMLSESDISGFVLERADRISAGLECLSKKDVDVVLLDLSLPDSQGLDTLQNVVLAAPKVPIVVMNNLDDEELALQAVQVGAQDYMVKGYMDTHALTRAIRYAIERKRSEEELRRVNHALKTLSDCNKALVRATDEASLLYEICRTLVTTGGYRLAWVGYAERDKAKTVRPVACAGCEEGYLATLNITWADTESGRGPIGTAIRTGKICKANNILTNPSFTPWRSNALERGYAASIALPLIGSGGPFGALNIYAKEVDAFDEQEEGLLRELADDLAYGILALRTHAERAQAVESLQKSEERFRILFEDSPISLWEEDFSGVKRYLEELQRLGVKDIQAFLENHPEHVTECVKQIKILDVNKATLRLYQAENKADIRDHSEKIIGANSYETIGDELVGILQGETKFDKEVVDQTLAGDKIMIRLGWTAAPGHEDALSRVIVSKIDITKHKQAEEALQQAKEFAENVIQTANAIFVQLDIVGNVQKLNTAAEEITGYSRKELEGKNWFDILAPRDRYPYVWEEYIRLTERGETPEIFENPILTKHGEERHILWKNSVLCKGDKVVGTISFGIDITERKQAEEKNRRQLDHLTALSEIDRTINSSLDMRLTLDTILAQIATQLGIDAVALLLLNPHKQVLEYVVGRGFRTQTLQHTHLRLGDSYAGRAALGRQIVHISNLQVHRTDFLRSPTFSQEGFVCYFGVPLIAKGEVKGVLEIFHRTALNPDTEWLDFMETLAGQAAIAIDNSQLFDNLQRSNLKLMQAYDATIEGWSQAMDLRDRETEGHTLRVTELTMRLARAMGMGEDEIVHARRGALLHDMGKLGIPDAILFKPGELNNEEWALMKQHPQFAYNMLSPIAYLRPALDIPYCHHEKWDGTGYPRGLKGEQIPLAARIFAIADVWDALNSDRPYRAAWSKEKVHEHIKALAGTHFDPQVVNVFLESGVLLTPIQN